MKQFVTSVLLVLIVLGCAANNPNLKANGASATIIDAEIPFQKGVAIQSSIKRECDIQKQLSEYIQKYAIDRGIEVIRKEQVEKNIKGKVLLVNITNAVSLGNPWTGHRKYTSIKGILYNNGKEDSVFTATRTTKGGAFSGFKGSCTVLNRTIKVLGSDVSRWLLHPVDGAHLGDHI